MTTGLTEVKHRIVATRQIAKATSALQKVAAVQVARSRKAEENARLYWQRLSRLVRDLASITTDSPHHLTVAPRPGPTLLVVLGSDRGLCGLFNALLLGEIERLMAAQRGHPLRAMVMGKVTARRVRRLGVEVVKVVSQPRLVNLLGDDVSGDIAADERHNGVAQLLRASIAAFTEGRAGEVQVLYARFESTLRQRPVVDRLLPVNLGAAGSTARAGWTERAAFEPGPDALLETLLPEFLETSLRYAAFNSIASENAARQMAMSRAADGAGDILSDLLMEYSRRRQEDITNELLEIVGGTR